MLKIDRSLSLWCVIFAAMLLYGLVWNVTVSAQDIYNPHSCDDDLVLPMPNGASMAFRPVFIGQGNKPFIHRNLYVGYGVGIKEKEEFTRVRIHGSFHVVDADGQPDWVYYLGKYEVTEAQYYAIMAPGKFTDSQYPICQITYDDAQEFIQRYNQWLFSNALDALPKSGGYRGFLRLPTEVEWEFAARGGNVVEESLFQAKHPYSGSLTKYEWFSGPTSSHDKIKKIGMRQPNPLGLYDMLGNVSELATSFHTGGIVERGGNYYTLESTMRASLRKLLLRTVGISDPVRQPTLGMRLLISSNQYVPGGQSPEYLALQDDFLEICAIAEKLVNQERDASESIDFSCIKRVSTCKDEDFTCLSDQIDQLLSTLRDEFRVH